MKQAERPGLHRWSRPEYARLIDCDFLGEDHPVELLDGFVLVKHRTAVLLAAKANELETQLSLCFCCRISLRQSLRGDSLATLAARLEGRWNPT